MLESLIVEMCSLGQYLYTKKKPHSLEFIQSQFIFVRTQSKETSGWINRADALASRVILHFASALSPSPCPCPPVWSDQTRQHPACLSALRNISRSSFQLQTEGVIKNVSTSFGAISHSPPVAATCEDVSKWMSRVCQPGCSFQGEGWAGIAGSCKGTSLETNFLLQIWGVPQCWEQH